MERSTIDPASQWVALWVIKHLNRRTGTAFPSRETLCEKTGKSPATIDRAIRAMRSEGWTVISGRGGPAMSARGVSARANTYLPPAWLLAEQAEGAAAQDEPEVLDAPAETDAAPEPLGEAEPEPIVVTEVFDAEAPEVTEVFDDLPAAVAPAAAPLMPRGARRLESWEEDIRDLLPEKWSEYCAADSAARHSVRTRVLEVVGVDCDPRATLHQAVTLNATPIRALIPWLRTYGYGKPVTEFDPDAPVKPRVSAGMRGGMFEEMAPAESFQTALNSGVNDVQHGRTGDDW